MANLDFNALQTAQAGQTPDQIASTANAAALPAPTNTITPESLQPAQVTPFSQPNPTAIPDVANLYSAPDLTPTPTETQANDLTTRIQTLNDSLVGKSAYQATEDQAFGVNDAQKTISDLNVQLTGLKNDAAAIPLLLKQNASSQGISQTLINRQQDKLTNDNAIKALTVSSLMSAASGQLANAQSLSDKAVSAKFDPIQEQITSATNNLNLILNSPEYSLEQKNRAQKQLDIQNANQAKLDQQKADAAAIQKVAIDAATNGADAQTLKNITSATTPVAAAQAAAVFTQQQNNIQLAQTVGVNTKFVNKNGEFFNTQTGEAYSTPEKFYAAAGVTSFPEAYQKGLVSDISNATIANMDLVKQAQAKYVDVNIPLNSTPDQIAKIIQGSKIYQDQVRAPGSSGSGPTTPTENPVDAQVKQIILDNPGQYGNAADAIDAQFGKGTATKYDSWLKDVYINKKDPNKLQVKTENLTDEQTIARAIENGTQPPVLTGLYSKSAAVKAQLAKDGYDLTGATQDWTATQKYLATLNGAAQVRLRQAVQFAYESLPLVEDLSSQWNRSSFPALNATQLTAAKQGLLGSEAQNIATQLDSQIRDMQSELATVYKGGNSSTDTGLQQASEMLNANWSASQLQSAIGLIRKNLGIRINSINNAGVAGVGDNSYAPDTSTNDDPLGLGL